MAKCKFKVGDKVKPTKDNNYGITGQDMELGVVTYVGKCGVLGKEDMKVKVLKHKIKTFKGIGLPAESRFFEKIGNETIVIYRDDNEVTALDKSTGKKAIARCNPADEFDFHIGAKLAFSRLMGEPEENKQDKLIIVKCDRYEVGDKVLIRDWDDMEREFGLFSDGYIRCVPCFTTSMKKFCNKIITVCKVGGNGDFYTEGEKWAFSRCMIAGKVVKESEKPVDEFKPYLEDNGTNYGIIGEETPFKDAIGRPLRVGDTVELYNSDNKLLGENVVVSEKSRGAFVMGISLACGTNGKIGCGFKIILKRKHEEIADGETVDGIKYIKQKQKGGTY